MSEVKTVAGKIEVSNGKNITPEDGSHKGFKDGEPITTFKIDDTVKFKFESPKDSKRKPHVEDGTIIDLHPLDAAIAEKQGKGKIVK